MSPASDAAVAESGEPTVVIRPERPDDAPAIEAVVREAFVGHPYSNQTEHRIVAALREARVLSVSLVAELDGRVVGHAAFSPVRIEDGSPGWFGLGPLAVAAAYQRRGIGRMLVERGIDQLRRAGAAGCVLVGDPAFYRRLGFENVPALSHPGVPAENLLGMSLVGSAPRGVVTFHEAFHVGPEPASSSPA